MRNTFAKVKPDWNYWGLIDLRGNYVLKPQFHQIYKWSNGMARAAKKETSFDHQLTNNFNGEYGYVNSLGELITDFSFINAQDFSNGLAAVNQNSQWGFLNTKGEMVIPNIYKEARPFQPQGAIVCSNGKWGLIDYKGNWIFENKYDSLSDFAHGLAIATLSRKSFVINEQEERIINLPDEYHWYKPVSPSLILMGTSSGYPGERTYGFINLKGEVTCPPQFYTNSDSNFDTGVFSDEMLAVTNQLGLVGFVNSQGELIIPLQYESATAFKNGIAKVMKNEEVFFINKMGQRIDYQEPITPKRPFDEVGNFADGVALARVGNHWGVIDENNSTIIDFKFRKRFTRSTTDSGFYLLENHPQFSCRLIGLCEERKDDMYAGYIDKYGNTAIEFKYKVVEPFTPFY